MVPKENTCKVAAPGQCVLHCPIKPEYCFIYSNLELLLFMKENMHRLGCMRPVNNWNQETTK